jgi:single-strand DNA-binding protein
MLQHPQHPPIAITNPSHKGGLIMLNSVVLAGNLGNDPEIHFSTAGEPIANFQLAFRATKKTTGWIKVTCFQKLAGIVEQHIKKGDRIGVSGSLAYHQWETDEGSKRSAIQMIANTIEFINVKGFSEGENHENGTPF